MTAAFFTALAFSFWETGSATLVQEKTVTLMAGTLIRMESGRSSHSSFLEVFALGFMLPAPPNSSLSLLKISLYFPWKGTPGHSHNHTHTHENTKAVLNRLSKAIGHLESIKKMVENGRDCSEVLIQLSAVRSAINNTGKVILQDHIQHCLVDAIESGDMQEIEELNKAIDRFMK